MSGGFCHTMRVSDASLLRGGGAIFVVFGFACFAMGIAQLLQPKTLGTCSVHTDAEHGGEEDLRYACTALDTRDGSTSWALVFEDALFDGEPGVCRSLFAVRFAGQLVSEASCHSQAHERASIAYENCVLDGESGDCYVPCNCEEDADGDRNGWCIMIIFAGFCFVCIGATAALSTLPHVSRRPAAAAEPPKSGEAGGDAEDRQAGGPRDRSDPRGFDDRQASRVIGATLEDDRESTRSPGSEAPAHSESETCSLSVDARI